MSHFTLRLWERIGRRSELGKCEPGFAFMHGTHFALSPMFGPGWKGHCGDDLHADEGQV